MLKRISKVLDIFQFLFNEIKQWMSVFYFFISSSLSVKSGCCMHSLKSARRISRQHGRRWWVSWEISSSGWMAGGRSLAQKWVRREPFADQIVFILVPSRVIVACSFARQLLSQCLSEPRGMIGYRRTVWENLTRVLGAKLTTVDNTWDGLMPTKTILGGRNAKICCEQKIMIRLIH